MTPHHTLSFLLRFCLPAVMQIIYRVLLQPLMYFLFLKLLYIFYFLTSSI